MKLWNVHYYASDLAHGCSCCSNPTFRWRKATCVTHWTARVTRWWLLNGPVWGMQVMTGGQDGMYDPRIEPVEG